MASDQPKRLDLRSHDIVDDKIAELLTLFPEVRTEDGQIDFDRLKLALGKSVDVGKERYGLSWPGKAECFKTIQSPSLGTLLPAPEESVNWDTTENLIIEGDNLEVLKLLQKSYLGKVKMIYIDPPYNTGNDFIYPDDYSESLKTYLEYTGQVDAEGRRFSTNTDTDGRFHSKWLSMMYPRLYLARNLLRDDGVIFISIDDGELRNLRALCDDIFGEESIIGTIVWRRRQVSDNRNLTNFSTDHEYVLAVGRASTEFRGESIDLTKYSNADDDPRGPWMSDNLTGLANAQERPNLHYDLVNPATGLTYPPLPSRGWAYEPKRMTTLIAEDRILWPRSPEGRPRLKRFLADIRAQRTGFSSMQQPGFTTDGTRELESLFGEKILGFPKPVELTSMLVKQVAGGGGDIVLDFFAGSGTTAQSVLELNSREGANRRFILVQLPEPTGREDYPTIADITKERVRRVVRKLNDEMAAAEGQDRGFRVFKLAESSFDVWEGQQPRQLSDLVEQLALHVDNVRDDRSAGDVLFELLLKSGYPLSAAAEELIIDGKRVFSVANGAFLVCLERPLSLELMREVAERKPERFVVLDEGFAGNDQLKANAVQIFNAADVTFRTV